MRNCELTSIGGLLDSKGYGFGVPQSNEIIDHMKRFLIYFIVLFPFIDSPYRDILSDTILKLQDEGLIQKYYNKWWKEAANLKCDQEDKRKDIASELGFANIGGIFVILAIGLLLSMVVAAIEFSIKIRNRKGRGVNDFIDNFHSDKFLHRFLSGKKCNAIFALLFSMSVLRNVVPASLLEMFHYSILIIAKIRLEDQIKQKT